MNFNTFLNKESDNSNDMDQVLESHFNNIEKGQFDPTNFCADLKAVPPEHVDYRKCAQSLMKLTKERVTGTNNYKMVHNLEKMMEILLENFTVKKSGLCEVLFFPNQGNEAKIIEYLKSARKSIWVCMFAISNERMCTALLEAHLRGVNVRLITSEEELRIAGSNVRDLSDEGIAIRTDSSSGSMMHNKFVVIDQKILMNGSYNWTVSATNVNQENVVIMENDYLIETFTMEFNKLWKQFNPQSLDYLDNKTKNKTRLFLKYQEGQKREKKQIALVAHDDDEILDVSGIDPNSKKISKMKRIKDILSCKRAKKMKDVCEDEEDEEEIEAEEDMSVKKPEAMKFFFKVILFIFSVFTLITLAQIGAGTGSTLMALE